MPAKLTIITLDGIADHVGGKLSAREEAEVLDLIEADPRARAIIFEKLRRASSKQSERHLLEAAEQELAFEK